MSKDIRKTNVADIDGLIDERSKDDAHLSKHDRNISVMDLDTQRRSGEIIRNFDEHAHDTLYVKDNILENTLVSLHGSPFMGNEDNQEPVDHDFQDRKASQSSMPYTQFKQTPTISFSRVDSVKDSSSKTLLHDQITTHQADSDCEIPIGLVQIQSEGREESKTPNF
jgi:hypothetical protein